MLLSVTGCGTSGMSSPPERRLSNAQPGTHYPVCTISYAGSGCGSAVDGHRGGPAPARLRIPTAFASCPGPRVGAMRATIPEVSRRFGAAAEVAFGHSGAVAGPQSVDTWS